MRKLAELANASASTINNLEKGHVTLDVEWIDRLAKVFDVPPDQIVDLQGAKRTGFSDDAKPYAQQQDDRTQIKLSDQEFIYQAETRVLDQIGIQPGTLLVIDMAPSTFRDLKSEDIVLAQKYHGAGATTLLRQFIAPSLLITNSSEPNQPSLNTRTDDVTIKGVATSIFVDFNATKALKIK
jgi:transcriptional regulator with XRE-family HTH domain